MYLFLRSAARQLFPAEGPSEKLRVKLESPPLQACRHHFSDGFHHFPILTPLFSRLGICLASRDSSPLGNYCSPDDEDSVRTVKHSKAPTPEPGFELPLYRCEVTSCPINFLKIYCPNQQSVPPGLRGSCFHFSLSDQDPLH